MDICLPEHKLVLEHDGYYYHSSMAARERAERKDRALREAGYQVLRIWDSRELAEPVVLQKTKILYRFDEQDRHLDQMIASVFCYLDLQPLDFHHRRDQYAINQMYFHERKKRTLAVEYPAIALAWSTRNADKPDTVFIGSPRKVWWHCPKCQQEYRATIANRTKRRSNCPFCANLQAYEKNCLAVLRPEIEKAMSGNARRDISDRVPSASGFAGMAVHIVPVGVQAERIVCKPATLPLLLSIQRN